MDFRNRTSRRRMLALMTGAATAGVAGIYHFSEKSMAVTIDVTSISIPDQDTSSPDSPNSIPITLTGEYAVESNVPADTLELTPQAKVSTSAHDWTNFNAVSYDLGTTSESGQIEFTRDLLKVVGLRDVFPTDPGQSVDREIQLVLNASVLKDGTEIGTGGAQETFNLTMTHETASANIGFSVDGNVKIT